MSGFPAIWKELGLLVEQSDSRLADSSARFSFLHRCLGYIIGHSYTLQ